MLFVIVTRFELKEISERAWSSSHPRLSSLLLLTKLERQLLNQRRHLSSEASANFTTWGPVQLFTSTLCPEFALESLIRFKKKKKITDLRDPCKNLHSWGPHHQNRKWMSKQDLEQWPPGPPLPLLREHLFSLGLRLLAQKYVLSQVLTILGRLQMFLDYQPWVNHSTCCHVLEYIPHLFPLISLPHVFYLFYQYL